MTLPIRQTHSESRDATFWIILVAIGLAGIWLLSGACIPAEFHEVSKSLGEALVIAVILAATVDRFLKGRLVWEIASNVWQYVARHPVAPEIAEYLHDALQEPLIRRNSKLTYSIFSTEGKLRVVIEIEYDIENYGNGVETYPPGSWIGEKIHRDPKFESISCTSNDAAANFSAAGDQLEVVQGGGNRVAHPKGHEKIEVKSRAADFQYHVYLKYSLDEVKPHDSDTIVCGGPTIGIMIGVKDLPPRMEFAVGDQKLNSGSSCSFPRVFLKEQQLDARWNPAE